MKSLTDQIEAKAIILCSREYHTFINRMYTEFQNTFHVGDSDCNKNPYLKNFKDMRYSTESEDIITHILPNYIEHYTKEFISKVDSCMEMLAELEVQ